MSTISDKWVSIDDFSPGIYSAGTWQLLGANTAGQIVAGAPLGAAQETNTYRCVPTPNGKGLMPAPRGTQQTALGTALDASYANIDYFWIMGAATVLERRDDNVNNSVPTLAVFWSHETVRKFSLLQFGVTGTYGPTRSLMSITDTSAQPAVASMNRGTAMIAQTTMSNTTPYVSGGYWTVASAADLPTGGGTTLTGVRTQPDPAALTSYKSIYASNYARIFAHQNRLVYITYTTMIQENATPVYAGRAWNLMNYNDPANSTTFPTPATSQNFCFDTEDMAGFAAFGSLNANTLLLVRETYGGAVVQGDIANPILTRMPAVTGTNGIVCNSAITPLGMAYASKNNGVHVWAGGANSQKISNQLRDDFWYVSDAVPLRDLHSGPSVHLANWGDYILVSNLWMYHIPTQSWWRINDPSTHVNQTWWCTSWYGNVAWGANSSVNLPVASSWEWGYKYDTQLGATSWSWQSQAIPVTVEKFVEVNEVILTVQGAGTIKVSGRGFDGTSATATSEVTVTLPAEAANQPVKCRVPFALSGYNIILKLVADNGSSTACTLHRIDIGYDDGNPVTVY